MEEKNQNIEESNKKDLTQEEIEDVQGGGYHYFAAEREGIELAEQVDLNN